jgi:hypothetical protein
VVNFDRVNYATSPRTDARGRCTFSALIPGAKYRFQLIVNGRLRVSREFTVEPGKSRKLPDIVAQ